MEMAAHEQPPQQARRDAISRRYRYRHAQGPWLVDVIADVDERGSVRWFDQYPGEVQWYSHTPSEAEIELIATFNTRTCDAMGPREEHRP